MSTFASHLVAMPRSISFSIHLPLLVSIPDCPTNCSAVLCDDNSHGTSSICLDAFSWTCGIFGPKTAALTLNYSEGYLQLRQAPHQDPRSLQTLRVSRHEPPDPASGTRRLDRFARRTRGRYDICESEIDKRFFQQSPVPPQPEEDLRLVRLPGR